MIPRKLILPVQRSRLVNCRRAISSLLEVEGSVEEALRNGEPVVALESTIVAHGMPFPQNLETAQSVESIVRSRVSETKDLCQYRK